jgi:hypothetical protein
MTYQHWWMLPNHCTRRKNADLEDIILKMEEEVVVISPQIRWQIGNSIKDSREWNAPHKVLWTFHRQTPICGLSPTVLQIDIDNFNGTVIDTCGLFEIICTSICTVPYVMYCHRQVSLPCMKNKKVLQICLGNTLQHRYSIILFFRQNKGLNFFFKRFDIQQV